MASPQHSLSRRDIRPPAGANPEVPSWAKDDYVLSRWIKEERARRRRFLADQVLEPNEPRPHYTPSNTIGNRIFGPIRNAFKPLDAATGGRFFHGWMHTKKWFILFIFPIWTTHYVAKYHILNKPNALIVQRPPVFPDRGGHDGHH